MFLNKAILVSILFVSANSFAYDCSCSLDYKTGSDGIFDDIYTETVTVKCPKGKRGDLKCEGFEFAGDVETICRNEVTHEKTSDTSFPSPEGEPTFPWPSCSLSF